MVEHPGRAMAYVESISIVTGETRVGIELPETTLAGTVVDGDGRGVAGARVWVRATSQTNSRAAMARALRSGSGAVLSADDGSFVLHGVHPDTPLVVAASHSDHRPVQSTPITVRAGGRVDDVQLTLERGGDLLVRVAGLSTRAAVSIQPVDADAEVAGGTVKPTESDGSARFTGLAPGVWEVSVQVLRTNAGARTARVTVTSGETAEVDIDLP